MMEHFFGHIDAHECTQLYTCIGTHCAHTLWILTHTLNHTTCVLAYRFLFLWLLYDEPQVSTHTHPLPPDTRNSNRQHRYKPQQRTRSSFCFRLRLCLCVGSLGDLCGGCALSKGATELFSAALPQVRGRGKKGKERRCRTREFAHVWCYCISVNVQLLFVSAMYDYVCICQ